MWKNGGSDPHAVWHHRSDGSRDEARGLGIGPREGVLSKGNLERAIVTNGDFTAYVCDSAAMRPSSQITLGRLVIFRESKIQVIVCATSFTLAQWHTSNFSSIALAVALACNKAPTVD